MFIGHYGVALAAKKYQPKISLGLLFFSVQFLDVLFSVFVLTGIEKMRIVPGFTSYNPYDLYFMPFTHSLLGAVIWSLLLPIVVYGFFWKIKPGKVFVASVSTAVFSHFLLDLPVHTADLAISFSKESLRIGFGLWNYIWVSLFAELIVFGLGAYLYLSGTNPSSVRDSVQSSAFFIFLVTLLIATPFLPVPHSPAEFAIQALGAYLGLAIAAERISLKRQPL